ncbi:Y-family DNA polymerase [Streptomyces xanthophaeus]
MTATSERRILPAHFHLPSRTEPDQYEDLLALAEDITPLVRALPPDAAHLDITGSLHSSQRDAEGIAELLRLRALARYGVETTCAVAPNRMLATMTAAATSPGITTVIGQTDIDRWLWPRPVAALYGGGPATAAKLRTLRPAHDRRHR